MYSACYFADVHHTRISHPVLNKAQRPFFILKALQFQLEGAQLQIQASVAFNLLLNKNTANKGMFPLKWRVCYLL